MRSAFCVSNDGMERRSLKVSFGEREKKAENQALFIHQTLIILCRSSISCAACLGHVIRSIAQAAVVNRAAPSTFPKRGHIVPLSNRFCNVPKT